MKVYDLRGLELRDPLRKKAYPSDDSFALGTPMRYLHLMSTNWYFDASDPANAAEAERVIGDLCFRAETAGGSIDGFYRPLHIVVDNYGGTIIGIRREA
jgi:hypothetical protein